MAPCAATRSSVEKGKEPIYPKSPPTSSAEQEIPLVEVVENPDFGRDKELKALLKTLQPKAFKGEGSDVARDLEEWIIAMEDYFALAKYNYIAQAIMGRAKLRGISKDMVENKLSI